MVITSQKPSWANRFKRWWDLQTMPSLDWMQIEVTTRCNAQCHYCPRTTYCNVWNNRDLSLEIFNALLPVMADTRMVHLQGWGEPFLHPHLFEMIALAKTAGCRVGTTTNGMLLDTQGINRLVRSGIDHVAFSLTGIGEKNDLARRGTQFTQIVQAIADLAGQKKALRAATPTISIAYLLLRSHLQDMSKLVPALAGSGAEQVVISTLDFVSHKSLSGERLVPANLTQYRELEFLFDKLEGEAEKKDISLFYNLVLPNTAGSACTENPRRALFISSDGSVSPCVFSNIPAKDTMHIGIGEEDEYQALTFGCVADESLPVIWKRPSYRAFRKHFGVQPYALCDNCPKRYKRADE